MKRIVLFLVIAAMAGAAEAKERVKNATITGSWKETTRMDRGKLSMEYTDTTYYDFLIGNEYTTQRQNSFMYRGTYKLTPGRLDLGMRAYKVEEMSANRMVLRDDAGVYEFRRYDKLAAMAENNSAATHAQRAMQEQFSADAVIHASSLAGRWESYKRTSSETMTTVDHDNVIRMLDLRMKNGTMEGGAYATKDMDGAPSWKIWKFENGVIFLSGKSNRQLKVIRANGSEVITEEGTITNFFKKGSR